MLIISKRDTLYLHSCSDVKIQGTGALNQKHLVRVINLVRITETMFHLLKFEVP